MTLLLISQLFIIIKMKLILLSVALLSTVLATPDCYDVSVTTKREDFFEPLPKLHFYGTSDWLAI